MLTRIRIEGYKSFRRLDVRLKPLSVIIGPNASGKSNFVDALGLLGRVGYRGLGYAFESHRGTPLQSLHPDPPLTDSGVALLAFSTWHVFSASLLRKIEAELFAQADRRPARPRRSAPLQTTFALTVGVSRSTGRAAVLGEKLETHLGGDPWETQHDKQNQPDVIDEQLDTSMSVVGPHGQGWIYAVGLLDGKPAPGLSITRADLVGWMGYRLRPEVLSRRWPVEGVGRLGPAGERLPALLNAVPAGLAEMNSWLKYLLPAGPEVTIEGPTPDHYVSLAVHEYGMFLTGTLVSDGTWRVMGLIAALSRHSDTTLVAIEEPENGIHPSRYGFIRELAEEAVAAGKQVIFTTHSPLFAEHFDLDSIYAAYHPDPEKPDAVITPLSRHPVGRKLKKKGQLVAAAVMDPGEGLALGDYMAMGELE